MQNSNFKTTKQQQSDAKRLASLKQRQDEKKCQLKQISDSLKNLDVSHQSSKRIKFDFDDEVPEKVQEKSMHNIKSAENNLNLFESSESEENDEDDDKRFSIKRQFEGEKGRELLEQSSGFTDERFKLDERFKEDEDDDGDELVEKTENDDDTLETEKNRHMAILEDVLGFQVSKRPPEEELKKKKKHIRFDPESENAQEFIRVQRTEEKVTKSKVTKEVSEPEPVVSKERYFEVASDLKEVFGASSSTFSFGQQFNISEAKEDPSHHENIEEEKPFKSETKKSNHIKFGTEPVKAKPKQQTKTNDVSKPAERGGGRKERFFWSEDDPRLKEGVEFFRRTKPMEEVRSEFLATRDEIVDMYKRNRRLALKSPRTFVRSQQNSRGQRQNSHGRQQDFHGRQQHFHGRQQDYQ